MANDAGKILKTLKEQEIEWVDLRFTDPKGKWQHLSMCSGVVDEDNLTDGFMFDGSSIAGWKAINESDMILKPDLDAFYLDPFSATPMAILFCDIVDPGSGELYARDPRSTAKRAEAYLGSTGIGDTIYVGPEAEFFLFQTRNGVPTTESHDSASYFDLSPVDQGEDVRRQYRAVRQPGGQGRDARPSMPDRKPAYGCPGKPSGRPDRATARRSA